MNNRVKELMDLESIIGESNCSTEHYDDYIDKYDDHYSDSHYNDENYVHSDSHYADGQY